MARTQWTGVGRLLLVVFSVSAAVWLLALIAFAGYVSAEWALTGLEDSLLSCPLSPSSSVYGEPYWSWSQLGKVCDFSSFERGPGLSRWAFLGAPLGWGSALFVTARLMWRSRGKTRAAESPQATAKVLR